MRIWSDDLRKFHRQTRFRRTGTSLRMKLLKFEVKFNLLSHASRASYVLRFTFYAATVRICTHTRNLIGY